MLHKSFAYALIASMVITVTASASPFDPLELMREYTTITLGDATINDPETPGTVFVGGTLTAPNTFVINGNGGGGAVFDAALVVGGDTLGRITMQNGNVLHQGVFPTPPDFNNNGGGSVTQGFVDVAGVAQTLNDFSEKLAGLADNGVTAPAQSSQNGFFTVSGGSAPAVLNITDMFLMGLGNPGFQFVGAPVATIINVSGTSITIPSGFNFNKPNGSENILFNFFEATTVSIDSPFGASILAPKAFVSAGTGAGRIQGNLVSAGLSQSVEIDGPRFDPPPFEIPHPIPVPGAAVLMASGLMSMAGVRRYRFRVRAAA